MAPDVSSMNSAPSTPALKNSKKPPAGPNVLEVVFGSLLIKPWYPSFYPEELVGRRVERLYVCQWCFKYSKELMGFLGHLVSTNYNRDINGKVMLTGVTESMPTIHHTTARRMRLLSQRLLTVRNRWRKTQTLRTELVSILETLPRHEERVLRCHDLLILPSRCA